ncbi:MAG: PIG-L family deacetylase, partial [Anaerolineae bacterium]|nr:PIG-L family deacetylase [Anaerolineae bacterium]
VLSCGGQMACLAAQGTPVHVVTVFAGDAPAPGTPLSDFAAFLHAVWDAGANPFAVRREEDRQALRLLGATWTHLPHQDAIYRRAADGGWLYPDHPAVFGPVAPGEAEAFPRALAQEVAPWCGAPGKVVLHAPLGIGGHVDHRLVREAAMLLAEAGHPLRFYEDFPYSDESGELEAALADLPPLRPEVVAYGEAAFQTRLAAIACYRSQMGIVFGGEERMREVTRTHAAALAQAAGAPHPYAEREWVRGQG